MATSDGEGTLDSWLNKATDPTNSEDRWDCIQAFYQLVNQESDGPQVATRLLAHKIQSPQEKEALQALTVLEACMNNCGKRFHSEAAKFRFLNELIKVLSPKYLGLWSPEKVKDRVIEVFYSWTLWLKDQPKIGEAYRMLKKQGVVKKDPKLSDTLVMPPPPQRTAESVFDREDKAKLLARLLKSTRPEDLQTANRLIKNTIKEEQDKAERVTRRRSTLEEVETCAKQLKEQLDQYSLSGDPAPQPDDLKAMYERCDRLRPSLFRLASDTMDDDSALAQVLAANDELTLVVNAYKEKTRRKESTGGGGGGREKESKNNVSPVATSPREIRSYHLIDLSVFDSPQTNATPPHGTPQSGSTCPPSDSPPGSLQGPEADLEFIDLGLDSLILKPSQTQETPKTYHGELMQLSRLELNDGGQPGGGDIILGARGCASSNWTDTWSFTQKWSASLPSLQRQPLDVSVSPVRMEGNLNPPQSLANIYVPMEAIKPSGLEPITVYDQGGVHVSLHFAKDPHPGHPGVAVVIISTVNTSALLVKDLLFQAAVPKNMSVKLQPSSKTGLPPYNPLFPPPAVSQVLLLANPHKCKVRLRYKLGLLHGEQQLSETGEIDNFPHWVDLVGS